MSERLEVKLEFMFIQIYVHPFDHSLLRVNVEYIYI